jgi:hypothetical protein
MLTDDTNDGFVVIDGEATAQGERASLETPLAGADVPNNATITRIDVRIRCLVNSIVQTVTVEEVQLEGGSGVYASDAVGLSAANKEFGGDLAYWGITQQQARDFANGTGVLFFSALAVGTGESSVFSTEYVDLKFTYQQTVPLPTTF